MSTRQSPFFRVGLGGFSRPQSCFGEAVLARVWLPLSISPDDGLLEQYSSVLAEATGSNRRRDWVAHSRRRWSGNIRNWDVSRVTSCVRGGTAEGDASLAPSVGQRNSRLNFVRSSNLGRRFKDPPPSGEALSDYVVDVCGRMDAEFGARTPQSRLRSSSSNYNFQKEVLDSHSDYDPDFGSLYSLVTSIDQFPHAPPDLPTPSPPDDFTVALEELWAPFSSPAPPPPPSISFSSPSESDSLLTLYSPGAFTSADSPPAMDPLFSPAAKPIGWPSHSPPQLKRPYALIDIPEAEGDGSELPARKRRAASPPQIVWRAHKPPVAPPDVPRHRASTSRIKPQDACRCLDKTQKPARHWKTACPYNPVHQSLTCDFEGCGQRFSRKDNMDRHYRDFH